MTTLLIVFCKLVVSSLMLFAFYQLALRSRANYTFCRIYLLLIPFVSATMSGLSFEVYTPEDEHITVEIGADTGAVADNIAAPQPYEALETSAESLITTLQSVGVDTYIKYVALAISILLVLVAIYGIARMMGIKRRLKAEVTDDGYHIIRSKDIKTPFSFIDTIFVPDSLEAESGNYIIRHEKAHIYHKHYIDVWAIEFITRVLWFNPVGWLVRNELRNIHEFEADSEVIKSGADILAYQTLLLEEVAEESTIVANGFNHSFIRRRFRMMKSKTVGTLGKVGKVGTGVWMLIVFCLFTFTVGEANVIIDYVSPQFKQEIANIKKQKGSNESLYEMPKIADLSEALIIIDGKVSDISGLKAIADVDHVVARIVNAEALKPYMHTLGIKKLVSYDDELAELDRYSKKYNKKDLKAVVDVQIISAEQIKKVEDTRPAIAADGNPIYYSLPPLTSNRISYRGFYLRRTASSTIVTCVATCESDDDFFWFGGEQTYIEDAATGDHYKARRPLNMEKFTGFHACGMKGKSFELTIEFPPIPQSVKQIRLWHLCSWTKYLNGTLLNITDYEEP